MIAPATTLPTATIDELAAALAAAESAARPIAPHSERGVSLTLEDAYAVQRTNRAARQARGHRLVGRKIGLTSTAMQEQLGIADPDFGYLTEDLVLRSGATVARRKLIAPLVEAEIAFELGGPVGGPDVSAADVMAATAALAPALEIVDSRISDWRIDVFDTVADNASCARAVIGAFSPPDGLDLAALTAELSLVPCRDRRTETVSGVGSAVLGHPAEAVAWLARALHRYGGEALRAGDIVLSGAMARALPVEAGDRVEAHMGGLGDVTVTIADTSGSS